VPGVGRNVAAMNVRVLVRMRFRMLVGVTVPERLTSLDLTLNDPRADDGNDDAREERDPRVRPLRERNIL